MTNYIPKIIININGHYLKVRLESLDGYRNVKMELIK